MERSDKKRIPGRGAEASLFLWVGLGGRERGSQERGGVGDESEAGSDVGSESVVTRDAVGSCG